MSTDPTTSDPRLGTTFAHRYDIEARLGKGGFGAVYRARRRGLGRVVALKILADHHRMDHNELKRFQQEAAIVAAIDHPHVVRLVDAGQDADGQAYLAMEYLPGESLGRYLRRNGPLSHLAAAAFGRQILSALWAAHRAGVVHRDLKPENLLVTRDSHGAHIVKLLDFGIAKVFIGPTSNAPLTRAGRIIGSPKVMAPEQICGDPITPATDLYAFGCVMYEVLTGFPPFVRRTPGEYARAHLHDRPIWPTRDGERIVGAVADLVMACLSKRPEDRPASAEAVLALWPGGPRPRPRVAPWACLGAAVMLAISVLAAHLGPGRASGQPPASDKMGPTLSLTHAWTPNAEPATPSP